MITDKANAICMDIQFISDYSDYEIIVRLCAFSKSEMENAKKKFHEFVIQIMNEKRNVK